MMAASNTKESGSVDEERDVESVEDTLSTERTGRRRRSLRLKIPRSHPPC